MEKKTAVTLFFGMILLVGIIGYISADVFTGVCCERLKGTSNNGAWCQAADDASQCATGLNSATGEQYKSLATSCDQTSFCTLGTCVNQREGTCLEGVPQQTCNTQNNGYWVAGNKEDVAQCKIGCCVYGGAAFLGTATQCTYQSALAGLKPEFDTSITNEIQCIISVQGEVEGACVYQTGVGTITCKRTTGKECSELTGSDVATTPEFHAGLLCTAPELNTICGATKTTTCDGYDVYYTDNCGNKANIYDSAQYNNQSYWTYITDNPPCDDGLGNKNSRICGQCEYFQGSTCENYQDAGSSKPVYGDNLCASLDCGSYDTNGNGRIDSDEKNYKHGEKWCATFSDLSKITASNQFEWDAKVDNTKQNLPGSTYEVLECRNGEVIPRACEPLRNEICAGDYYDLNNNGKQDTSDFRTAECVMNKYQDCVAQTNQASCEDTQNRDCLWIKGTSILKDENGGSLATDADGNPISASCVPKFAPGLDITQSQNEGATTCSLASTACVIKYKVGLLQNRGKITESNTNRLKACVENCYCIPGAPGYEEWLASLNLVCSALGDCGNKINYIGEKGLVRDKVIDTGNFTKEKL